jgi:hypothetical protein
MKGTNMKNNIAKYIYICWFAFIGTTLLLLVGCSKPGPPSVLTYSPTFGSEETLITVEGMSFETVTYINFDNDVPANFNPSFGTDNALLFRVPPNAPLGDNTVRIGTEGGETTISFRVTLKAPIIQSFSPKSANEGSIVSFVGENFFEPLEVLFFDSIPGNIVYASEDSLAVEVPAGVKKGLLRVKANGGTAQTSEVFFSTTEILVNDFDGNGLRSETNKWIFYGVEQNSFNAVQNTNPEPLNNNFLKISGTDIGTIWIGGTENHAWDTDVFDVYPIESDINNTFLEMDLNSNGKEDTHLIIVLTERNGSINDFTQTIQLDSEGWERVSIPLNRFTDLEGFTIDPQKIKTVKLHLWNELGSTQSLEANIDNLKFVQIN